MEIRITIPDDAIAEFDGKDIIILYNAKRYNFKAGIKLIADDDKKLDDKTISVTKTNKFHLNS